MVYVFFCGNPERYRGKAGWDLMFSPIGKSYRVSHYRRLVIDLMHFSAAVPSIILERHMELGPLVEARHARQPSPTWSALFTKAFAIVCSRRPSLRTSYLKFPFPRFYEHPINIATLNIDRQLEHERCVLYALVIEPEKKTLAQLDEVIHFHQHEPVVNIPSYRSAVRLSLFPWPIRRLLWWGGLNMFGSVRCHNFGTFGLTSVGSLGAEFIKLVPVLTSTIHYGIIEPNGRVGMRLSFDHRVLDGAAAAEALAEMEQVLLDDIVRECQL